MRKRSCDEALTMIATLAWIVVAPLLLEAPAAAADKLGVVLMHAEQGAPGRSIDGLAAALEKAGYLVSRPDMCWSARRADEARFEDCLAAIDTAIVKLRNLGATRFVVAGLGLGGTAAIVYGAGHAGLAGVVALAPGHEAGAMAADPEIARSVDEAQTFVAQGKGDAQASFVDTGIGPSGAYTTEVATTADIYLSFFGPGSKAIIAGNIDKLSMPLLLVTASDDPAEPQRDASAFARAPAGKLNRHLTVPGGCFGVPEASKEAVRSWLDELAR
jgi:esterase/lipase